MVEMVFEFWGMRTNNLIDAFDSEKDALSALLKAIKEQGERSVEFPMLIEDTTEADVSRVLGIGSGLLERARSAA
jgi:hypothetical protein